MKSKLWLEKAGKASDGGGGVYIDGAGGGSPHGLRPRAPSEVAVGKIKDWLRARREAKAEEGA